MICPALLYPSMYPQVSPQKSDRKEKCCIEGVFLSECSNRTKINRTDKHIQEICKQMEIDMAESNSNRK